MTPETVPAPPVPTRLWLIALVPLILLAALLALIVRTAPGDSLRGDGVPPVERLAIQRAVLRPDGIVLSVLNDGPDDVTIAQVTVDDAYWAFTAEGGSVLKHLGRTTIVIPYPWVQGEAHLVKLVTSTGTTFEHEIPVAVATPEADARHLLAFTLIGLYVGVIPVVRAQSAEEAMLAIDAIREGGISILEITMTVPGAVGVIEKVSARYGSEARGSPSRRPLPA